MKLWVEVPLLDPISYAVVLFQELSGNPAAEWKDFCFMCTVEEK